MKTLCLMPDDTTASTTLTIDAYLRINAQSTKLRFIDRNFFLKERKKIGRSRQEEPMAVQPGAKNEIKKRIRCTY